MEEECNNRNYATHLNAKNEADMQKVRLGQQRVVEAAATEAAVCCPAGGDEVVPPDSAVMQLNSSIGGEPVQQTSNGSTGRGEASWFGGRKEGEDCRSPQIGGERRLSCSSTPKVLRRSRIRRDASMAQEAIPSRTNLEAKAVVFSGRKMHPSSTTTLSPARARVTGEMEGAADQADGWQQ
jgi:hypothetical protein